MTELCDAVGQPRDFATRGIAVNDSALRRANDGRFGFGHGGEGGAAIARRNRLLDFPHSASHARAARFIDHGTAGDLPRRLSGGFGVGHQLSDHDFSDEILSNVCCREQAQAKLGLACVALIGARGAAVNAEDVGW